MRKRKRKRYSHGFLLHPQNRPRGVAHDVLRLLEHASTAYAADPAVAVACAYSPAAEGADPALLRRTPAFSPWLWGTWRHRWTDLIGPTWDRDYSTWNGSPGFESGWDWNLNTRVFPAHGLVSVSPAVSRGRRRGWAVST